MLPHEPIIRWIALGLLSLGLLWFLAAAMGLRPRAVRVRRAIKRSGSGTMLCGACGHPAVSLGEITSCPECGSSYAVVGLDGRASGSRWAPSVFIVGLVLLGSWAVASIWLAPIAARWANERSIGAPMVERVLSTPIFAPTAFASDSGQVPDFALELDVVSDRPSDWRQRAGGPPAVLAGGTRRARLVTGGGATRTAHLWMQMADVIAERFPPDPDDPSLIAAMSPSSAGGLPAAMDVLELEWAPASGSWTLGSRRAGALQAGTGLDAGISAMRTHASARMGPSTGPAMSGAHADLFARLIRQTDSAPSEPPRDDALPAFSGLSTFGNAERVLSSTPYAAAAPMGLTAAIGASAALLLVAVLVFFLSWRTRRLPPRDAA